MRTVTERLSELAASSASTVALRFLPDGLLPDGDRSAVERTYGELDAASRRIAAALAVRCRPGDRALLPLPNGPEFVEAFLGCLRAGVIAVPVPSSARRDTHGGRRDAIVDDSRPAVVIAARSVDPTPAGVPVLALDDLPEPGGGSAGAWPAAAPDDVVYLQYSSGSTGTPKGVRNTHRCLMYQVELLTSRWTWPEPIQVVGWLPLYHDMGMIYQLLLPLTTGGTTTIMSPAGFAADPARWLTAVSRHRGNWIGGPDFAFRRCCDVFDDDAVAGLDLSAVRWAGNGAEPIRPDTLRRFAAHFAPAGLDADAITPAYGLAEAGLVVSYSDRPRGWRTGHYDPAELTRGVAVPTDAGSGRELASSGNYRHTWQLTIVDPESRTELPQRRVGEIWVGGPGLSAGYWERPELDTELFGARLADGSGPYLRTGDLGFIDGDELFVCGRRKDLVIVHGVNHHPNDIEHSLERAVDEIRTGGVCVVQSDQDHRVFVLVEVDDPDLDLVDVGDRIGAAVLTGHGLAVDEVVFLRRRGSLRRTTSGKLRRAATLAAYQAGELRVLRPAPVEPPAGPLPVATPDVVHDVVCRVLGVPTVGVDVGLAGVGLNSVRAAQLALELSVHLGRPVPVTLLYRHPTLRRLTAALTEPPLATRIRVDVSDAPERRHGYVSPPAVAVIGVGVRLPGGLANFDDVAAWLLGGGDAIGPVPAARAADGVPLTMPGGYLDEIDRFDAAFFGMTGPQAQAMDPQQRLLLEVAWHALEHAGLPAGRLRDTAVGVFVGQGHHEYAMLPLRAGHPEWIGAFHATGTSSSASAGRIAHHLGLTGPALTVDTACSASLVAIDTAVRHLASGNCSVALAGGVNVALSPETEQSLLAAGMLSPRSRCSTLGADADGYVRGEGAVLFVLKPLAVASADGDRVLGVIRGSAVAHDGASSGLTVPNPAAQAELVRSALATAGLAPGDVDAVELHGTGTVLGDPIEVSALAEVHAGRAEPLYLGSVKTNLGHLEAAAGAAGLLRALVALRHQAWPGTPVAAEPNPRVVELGLPYRMPHRTETVPLRRIGVSSFGFTGTLAHVVVEHPGATPTDAGPAPWSGWVPLAGSCEAAVVERARRLADLLRAVPADRHAEVLAGWRRHREHRLPFRAVVHAADPAALPAALDAVAGSVARAEGSGRVSLLVRDGDPVDELLAAMARWHPGAYGLSGVDGLLTVLSGLGLRAELASPAADAIAPAGGVLLTLRAGEPVHGVVALDVADGGQAGLALAYRLGAPLDWSVLDPSAVTTDLVADLPLYPFRRDRHWYPVPAQAPGRHVSVMTSGGPENVDTDTCRELGSAAGSGLSADGMRVAVAAMLECAPDSLGDADDLVAAGLESLDIHDLAARWRRDGVELSFAELFERPTLAAWWQLVRDRVDAEPVAAAARVDLAAPFALTPVQHAYWVGRDPAQPLGGVGCHVYAEFDGHGVDPQRLERAVWALTERHAMLRAAFTDDGRQQIRPASGWTGLTVHDLRAGPAAHTDTELLRIRNGASHRVLDVASGEVFDFALSLLPGGATRLHVNVDMLVADALSLQILLADLTALYAAPDEPLPAIGTSFPQYLADRAARSAGARERDRDYWRDRLPELPGAPRLPLRHDPAEVRAPRFTRYRRVLDADQRATLVERARKIGVTPSVVLAAAFAEVLAGWSEDPRLLLNVTLFDREDLHPDVPRLVADFTNVVLLACEPVQETFAERASRLQERLRADLAHSAYSGVEVLRDLARVAGRDAATAPVVFTSNLGRELLPPGTRDTLGELGWTVSQTPQVWLDHQVMEQDGGLLLTWDVVADLFRPGVLDAMFDGHGRLLDWLVAEDWTQPPPALLPAGQAEVRAAVNATGAPAPAGLLHERFFEWARREPSRTAVITDDTTLSYGELAERALCLGAALRADGVAPGDLVGVSLPKGPDQVVAVLGVLAAGAGYVPIGVDQPPARRDRIARAAGLRTVLTSVDAMIDAEPLAEPVRTPADATAYVIFTSGSTGEPKGVEITHAAALNTVVDVNDRCGVGADDRVLAVSALDFDLSVYDVFGLLGAGGAVVCITEDERRDAHSWAQAVRQHGVTVWNTVPVLLEMLLAAAGDGELDGLRVAMVSGDWVPTDLAARLREQVPGATLVAMGGATEASIWSNAFEVPVDWDPTGWRSVPYGLPLANQCFRVVDAAGRDRPDWVPGELWIGGLGVAVGYRGDPERTADRFVTDGGERWYRTGDLGRYRPDGVLEFLGRRDHQVKVRGHRIELGEIEAAITAHPAIDHAVAVVHGEPARIAAAVVAATPPAPAEAPRHPWARATGRAAGRAEPDPAPAGLEAGLEAELTHSLLDRLVSADTATDAVVEEYRPLVHRWRSWLAGRDTAPRSWDELRAEAADTPLAAVADRLTARLADLAAILRGELEAVTLLDDPVLAPESLVDAQPAVRAALDDLATWLAARAAETDGRLRIAELGARSGRTAQRLLQLLPPDAVEYTLLDGSAALLATATERLAGLPHQVRTARLGPLVADELLHSFDVVIANNALHRQPDPAHALATAALLLAPGGELAAVEQERLSPLALLTVALPERGFTGLTGIRQGRDTPLLSAAEWHGLLTGARLAAAPAASSDDGTLRLHGRRGDRALDVDAVHDWLTERLPAYMRPERIGVLPALPLSRNGKLDRAAAVAPLVGDERRGRAGHEPPVGPAEELVSRLWGELLGVPAPGRDADFFALGGDSLLATRLVARLRSAGAATATLRGLFAAPVLADYAATLDVTDTEPADDAATEGEAELPADLERRHEPFPATDVQRAYWLGRSADFALGGVATHYYTEFDGVDVDVERLERAWHRLIERHEMLRAVFDADGRQRILPEVPPLRIPVTTGEAALIRLREEMSHQVLDPATWPLFDVRAVHHGENRTRLAISLDNLILDGLSMRIVFTELATLYDDPDAELPPVRMSFRDYVLHAAPPPDRLAAAQRYWLDRLPELPPAPQLPLRTDPATVDTPRFSRREASLSAAEWLALKERARRAGLTPSAVLLTCFAEVLSAWSARADLTLNLTLFDRREVHPDVNHVLGDFTSLLLLAFTPAAEESWAARARALQQRLWADLENVDVSAVWVLRELARATGSGTVGMPVVFTSALGVADELTDHLPQRFPRRVWGVSQTPQVWLDHQVFEERGALRFNWDAVDELFHPGVLDGMFDAYRDALSRLVHADWDAPPAPLLPAGQAEVRAVVNATDTPRPAGLLHERFFEWARREPSRTAVITDDATLSYGELAERALRVGAALRERGVAPGELVGVSLPKGPDQVVAVLGVLAAGAGYVPIGVDQPPARRDRIAQAAGLSAFVDDLTALGTAEPLDRPVATPTDALAYVIFTSGSTGEPKGVEITHAAAVNTVLEVNRRWHIDHTDRVLAVSALDFDLSVYDVFGLLSVGGAVVCIAEDERRDPHRWTELVRRHQVTVWNTVPVLLEMVLTAAAPEDLDTLRTAMVSGDWVPTDLAARLDEQVPGATLVAMGGATEASIWSNAFEVPVDWDSTGWRSVPYGLPLANQRFRVVDGFGRDCPDWVAGELWIGGAGVAVGYRGDLERTADRFVTDGGERWYRTGDLGRYRPDGVLEFLGRRDHQVKVRGHRIELGEIEAAIAAHPAIDHAVAVVHGEPARIAAAVTIGGGDGPDDDELTAHLAARLPAYMLPERVQVLDAMPLTANGKVDRAAVRRRLAHDAPAGDDGDPPLGDTEIAVARLWSDALGVESIGRRQPFFALGGDSLTATKVVEAVRRRFAVQPTLREFYATPTVAGMAAAIDRLAAAAMDATDRDDWEDGAL